MKITIVTVCYNAEAHIEGCLRGVASQTHEQIEHIIVDGASTDGTMEIVGRYSHVTEVISERDRGIYDAMNKGLARATGEFVLFLNADDVLPQPTTLAAAISEMESKPGGDVYYGWLEIRSIDGHSVVFRPPPPEQAPALMVCGCLPHQSTLTRPSVFQKTGPFDLQYRYHADYDWFLKILNHPTINVRSISCVIGSFREGGASSQLANGQPEAYAIQNASPLYADSAWDKRRIAEFQKTLLNERIENARLREVIRAQRRTKSGQAPLHSNAHARTDKLRSWLSGHLPRKAVASVRSLRARRWW